MADELKKISDALRTPELNKLMYKGRFAVRMETHRILTDGRASRYPYPNNLSSRRTNRYLTTVISDNMMELKSSPQQGSDNVVRQLDLLQQTLYSELQSDERLWPLSLPPEPVYKHDLDFLKHHSTRYWISGHNSYLINKYGIKRQLIAGVRVNYSLNETLLRRIYELSANQHSKSMADFRNHLYFKMAQFFYLHRWLFTYLYGASPVSPTVKHDIPDDIKHPIRSLRCSQYGYTNRPDEQVTYDSLESHIEQLEKLIDDGTYADYDEFFGPVRLHGDAELMGENDNLPTMIKQGVKYLQFRSFDLDPFALSGISADTLDFLEVLMLYGLLMPLPDNLPERLAEAKKRNNEVALEDPLKEPDWLQDAADQLMTQLEKFITDYQAPLKYKMALKFVRRRLDDPSLTIGGQVASQLKEDSILSFGLKIANDRYSDFLRLGHPLAEQDERFSSTAHRLVMAAIKLGIEFDVGNQIVLKVGNHKETFAPDVKLDMPEGARQYVIALFPEVEKELSSNE